MKKEEKTVKQQFTHKELRAMKRDGERLGQALVMIMSLIATDRKGIRVGTIAVARLWAELGVVAKVSDVKVDNLFNAAKAHFERECNEVLEDAGVEI